MIINTQPTSIAQSRSPIVYRVSLPDNTYTGVRFFCQLWIWTGDVGARPATPNYTFTKYPNAQGEAIYDVSNVVLSALWHKSYEQLTSVINDSNGHAVWVQAQFNFTSNEVSGSGTFSNAILATAGYYDYINGINQPFTPYATAESLVRRVSKSQRLFLPVYLFNEADLAIVRDDGGNEYDIPLNADRTIASNAINYIDLSATALTSYGLEPKDYFEVNVYRLDGMFLKSSWRFEFVCEPKFDPVPLVYLNKYGVWDTFTFFKKSISKTESSTTDFKNNSLWPYDNTPTGKYYDRAQGMVRTYNSNAQDVLTLNTDFLSEKENDQIQDILVSERLYILHGDNDVAVVLDSRTLDTKTTLNDKLIQYTMTFKRAYMTINTAAV